MIEKLLVRLVGDGSSYRAMMAQATRQTQHLQKSIQGVQARLNGVATSMRSFGTALTLAVTLPVMGMATASVHAFAKFDQAMIESTSIMRVTRQETEQMRQTALSLSGASTKGPDELARSYFFLASAGLDAKQSMAALPQVLAFSTAGAFDMATATDLLTDAQSALGLTSKDAEENFQGMARVSDVLVKANTLANASVQQFSEALTNTAGATLKNFNKSVEEGVAVLAAYADQGVKANVAGTNLTRVTLLLQQAAQKNSKAHQRLGFSVFDAQGKMRSYADLIQQLERITGSMTDEQKAATLTQLGFQARVQNAILPLIGASQKIKEYERSLKEAGGTTEEVAERQLKSFTNQLKITGNQLKVVGVEVGSLIAPWLLKLNNSIRTAIGLWRQLNPETRLAALLIALMAAAIGPALIMTSLLLTSITNLVQFGLLPLKLALLPLVAVWKLLLVPMAMALISVLSMLGPWGVLAVVILGTVFALRLVMGSWEKVGSLAVSAINLIADAVIGINRVVIRSLTVLFGWMAGQFMRLWDGEFVGAFEAGMFKAFELGRDMLESWTKWAAKKIWAMLTGSESGTWEDAARFANKDFQAGQALAKGQSKEGLFGTFNSIVKEELDLFNKRQPAVAPGIEDLTNQMTGFIGKTQTAMEQQISAVQNRLGIGPIALPRLNREGIGFLPAGLGDIRHGDARTMSIQQPTFAEEGAADKIKQDTSKMVDLLQDLYDQARKSPDFQLNPLGG